MHEAKIYELASVYLRPDERGAHAFAQAVLIEARAGACAHEIADARNTYVGSGYLCVKCLAVFAAADHGEVPVGVSETSDAAQPQGNGVKDCHTCAHRDSAGSKGPCKSCTRLWAEENGGHTDNWTPIPLGVSETSDAAQPQGNGGVER